jgi:hypothetical protein
MKLNCVTCADILTFRRARSALNRLLKYRPSGKPNSENPTVIFTIFTMPLSLRDNFKQPKAIKKLRGDLWKILKENFGGLFAYEATHPISEKHPDVFHPHLNFLWVQKSGFRPFIDVERLRRLYSDLLNYKISDVDLYTHYSNKIPQIWKWCQYAARTFPNFATWCGPVKWFGKYPKSDQKQTFICPQCMEFIRVLGYIDSYSVLSYQAWGLIHGLDPPWENDEKITYFNKKHKAS